MKSTNNPKKFMNDLTWLLAGLAIAVLIIATAPPVVATVVLVITAVIVLYSKQLVLANILRQERRRIASQPNVHQRGYILQRLKQLPYSNDSYSTRDPLEEKTFTVKHRLDERLTVVYEIEFVKEEYVRAVDIGNEYQHTTSSYSLSPKWSDIHFNETVAYRYSGATLYHRREVKPVATLDHLPDDIIERIEYALINWELVSDSNQRSGDH